ncbi:MAG: hypothetical protein IPK42_09330 [Betaproteobacteria bacterium]|nr:hypothetical protein [Betaproteobacteria bacterium]
MKARAYLERVGEAFITHARRDQEVLRRKARAVQRPSHLQHPGNRHRGQARAGAGLARPARDSKSINRFVEHLKANDYGFSGSRAVHAAEQLPLNGLEAFCATLKDGPAAVSPAANGVQVVVLAGSRSQPVSEEQARPAIEQFLLNDRKRKLVEEDMKGLRAAAARSNM